MRNMSSGKVKRKPTRRSDSGLAETVRELRSSLGIPQAKLAEMLQVSRSQVAEWETGGDESPSVEKLLQMASLAPITEIRRWFWIKAGVDLETFRRDFQEEIKLRVDSSVATTVYQIPVIDKMGVELDGGELLELGRRTVGFPIEFLPHPTSTLCLRCAKYPRWVLSDDDLVILDRAVRDVNALVGKLVAVFVIAFPLWDELRSKTEWRPGDGSARLERLAKGLKEAVGPVLIVGRLDVQYEREQDPDVDPEFEHWRLILRLGIQASSKRQLALSEWQLGLENASTSSTNYEVLVRKGHCVLGEVIGWMRDRSVS
jgi:transcriptional regulator with XRE-family HTH domain